MAKKKRRGITNKQASYLAALQRDLGEPYSGNGMSMREATAAIDSCLERLEGLKEHKLPKSRSEYRLPDSVY